MKWHIFLCLLLLITSCSNTVRSPKTGLNVLFIGNSLTYYNDMPTMLNNLLIQAKVKVESIEVIAFPNYGLPDHWENPATREKITSGFWDVVVLQQGPSATEGRPYLLEYSKLFAKEIRNAGAQPALYMVWPSQQRFFDFDGVSDSYKMAAEQINGMLFPVGEAWRKAWQKDPDLALYGADGFHPTPLGSYLAALVIFEQLAKQNSHNLSTSFPNADEILKISTDLAKLLHDSAREANAEFSR